MNYNILNTKTVIDYVRSHPKSVGLIDPNALLESEELSDGNLNSVFRVFEAGHQWHSILVKQAVPYLRVAGESWRLSPTRWHTARHGIGIWYGLLTGARTYGYASD